MKAKTVNENISFERGQDPKRAMDVGMTPKRQLSKMTDILNELGINVDYGSTPSSGPDNYEIAFSTFGQDPYMGGDDISNYMGYFYTPEGVAKMDPDEASDPGWVLTGTDVGYGIHEYSDLEGFLRHVIEIHLGGKSDIKSKISSLENEADIFRKALEILEG